MTKPQAADRMRAKTMKSSVVAQARESVDAYARKPQCHLVLARLLEER